MSTLSGVALTQAQSLESYPTHGTAADPYSYLQATAYSLSPGLISDTLFDSRGRQYASLGHPLPAADVGIDPQAYGLASQTSILVRPRTETFFNKLGQSDLQRSGLAHVESPTGTFIGVYDNDSIDTQTHTDALGNAYRMEYITGGTISYSGTDKRTTRTGGSVDSYTLTHFDDENRPVAEMQSVPGFVTAVYDNTLQSFKIESVGTSTGSPYAFTVSSYTVGNPVPTKVYHYDSDDRLSGVSLPILYSQASGLTPQASPRPRYDYAYNHQGNQTLIRDPLGRETRFTFTDRGQQATRTLPLGFGTDGIASPSELLALNSQPSTLDFTEHSTYDSRGRQHLHISFEGVISENVYDGYGRMSHMNFYPNAAAHTAGTIAERWSYEYDSYGRKNVTRKSINDGNGGFTTTRVEETVYDKRNRIIAEISNEGILGYGFDSVGRMVYTAVLPTTIDLTSLRNGTLNTQAVASRITSYSYDLLGRLAGISEDATPSNTSDATLDTEHTFDLQGRMDTTTTTSSLTPQASSLVTDYDFDQLGRLDTQTDYQVDPGTPRPLVGEGPGVRAVAEYDYEVRADGKRTSLDETFWFDTDADGVVDSGEQKSTAYSWTYDPVGRLTDEVISHFDITKSQTDKFTYDLTGNRTSLTRDKGNNASVDEVITYDFDVNDRMISELYNDLTPANADTTTTYGYDHTQQTSKQVTSGIGFQPVSKQLFTYSLRGSMTSVINEGFTSSTLTSRERTSYEYDSKAYRVSSTTETGTTLSVNHQSEIYNLQSSTTFLADHHNHTGYAQTIRETKVENGNTRITDYTFGNDELLQRIHGVETDGTAVDKTLIFGHDGHGSVRIVYNPTGQIEQTYTFTAYGNRLAVHDYLGNAIALDAALTQLGYSGEYHDQKSAMQYLRARWMRDGFFITRDPFAGNMQDPQSLHKYAYVHGDPANATDPSGLMSLTAQIVVGAIVGGMVAGVGLSLANFISGGLRYPGLVSNRDGQDRLFRIVLFDTLKKGGMIAYFTSPIGLGYLGYYTSAWMNGSSHDYIMATMSFPGKPDAMQIVEKHKTTIKDAATIHGVPAELLASVLMYEVNQYSVTDFLFDDELLWSPEARSVGLVQLRLDILQQMNPSKYRIDADTRERLLDERESIYVLADVVEYMKVNGGLGSDVSNLANWDSLPTNLKERLVRRFTFAKDNLTPLHGLGDGDDSWGQIFGVEKGLRRIIESGVLN